jgi:UDP-GlcNAc3NAcA epimerase
LLKQRHFQKPCIVIRDQTEWVELVDHGFNQIIGVNADRLIYALLHAYESATYWDKQLYGAGEVSSNIISIMNKFFQDN